jgi:hypothetical protein
MGSAQREAAQRLQCRISAQAARLVVPSRPRRVYVYRDTSRAWQRRPRRRKRGCEAPQYNSPGFSRASMELPESARSGVAAVNGPSDGPA